MAETIVKLRKGVWSVLGKTAMSVTPMPNEPILRRVVKSAAELEGDWYYGGHFCRRPWNCYPFKDASSGADFYYAVMSPYVDTQITVRDGLADEVVTGRDVSYFAGKRVLLPKDKWTLIGEAPLAFWAVHEEPVTWTTEANLPADAIRSVAGRTLNNLLVDPDLPAKTKIYARGCYRDSAVLIHPCFTIDRDTGEYIWDKIPKSEKEFYRDVDLYTPAS